MMLSSVQNGAIQMTLTIRPVDATLGAVVTDVDLTELDDKTWALIYAAFLEYGVLVFPGQHLDGKAQGSFARRFGEFEKLAPKQTGSNIHVSNQNRDGSVVGPDDPRFQILRGNEGWHTDSTYMPLASKVAMLAALVVPSSDGETEFADMRAAWDVLDASTQSRLEKLAAYHSLYYSQAQAGYTHDTDNIYGFHDKGAPLRPIVKIHPETGRKSIYTGRHAYGIQGMSAEDSGTFLADLLHEACQPPRIYTHAWQTGDIVVWDNRCLMHRARPYDTSQPRVLRGTRIAGDHDTEMAPTFADERADGFQVYA
jgi:alpha-ketoglutarate-dependent taurine dioxygenase